MPNTKLCFYFRFISDGEVYYHIHRITLSPRDKNAATLLFGINNENMLPFKDFEKKYKNRRIEGKFKVVVLDQSYIIDPITYYANQYKLEEPGAITIFHLPICIDINAIQNKSDRPNNQHE